MQMTNTAPELNSQITYIVVLTLTHEWHCCKAFFKWTNCKQVKIQSML